MVTNRFILIPCLVLVFLFGCGSPTPDHSQSENIFGVDDRESIVSNHPELVSSLGRLPHGCTAAMIGRRLALTAAHCVLDKKSSDVNPSLGEFEAGFNQERVTASSWITAVWVGSQTPEQNRSKDWAILLLQDDIGDKTGWMGLEKNLEPEFPVTTNLLAYASDHMAGGLPLISKNCYIHKEDSEGRLLHDCDAVSGSSGGPMVRSVTGKKIHAIAVSEFRTGPVSMQRETYTHKYANIAISTEEVSPILAKITTSLELGQTPPSFPGVSYLVNLNARGGTPDPESPTSGLNTLKQTAPQLTHHAVRLIEKTSDLKNASNHFGQENLENLAIKIEEEAFSLLSLLDAIVAQPARADVYAKGVYEKLSQIKTEGSKLDELSSDPALHLYPSLRAKSQLVSTQIDTLLSLLNSQ